MTDSQFFFQGLASRYDVILNEVYLTAQILVILGIVLLCIYFVVMTLAVFNDKVNRTIMYVLAVIILITGLILLIYGGKIMANPNFIATKVMMSLVP